MKIIKIRKKKIVIISSIIIFLIIILKISFVCALQNYYNVGFSTGLVTATTLNVRSGPGVKYPVIATAHKNEYIRIFAGIGEWYIVQVEGDYIGAVSKKYIKAIYESTSNVNNEKKTNISLTSDEQEVFNLINKQRKENGLAELKIDMEVQRVAKIKAQDMVNNNYFSHNSPIYGSPFDMLKSFKISYKSAGENIAGNSNNQATVSAWMNSSGHRANILNSSYNYTGIGIVNSSKYGKIYVQMFIEK